jgi:hypothetical protein
MRTALTVTAAVAVLQCVAATAPRAPASLRDVLDRAGQYVVAYGESLATVIAEELYTQQLVARTNGAVLHDRSLRSELAFVSLAGSREWQAFRNVLSIDGRPIAGAEGRLERVFRAAPPSILGQARLIAAESARHNLGPLQRNFNAPTTPLQFLHPSHQDRFRFDKQADEQLGPERVWVVRFRERARGTLIRTPEGKDVPVEGRFWIVPEDGRVMKATFSARDFLPADPGPKTSRADIDVTWRHDRKLGLWVPAEMRERYSGPWREDSIPYDIVGHATYSNYRRFDVDVRIIGR